MLTQAVYAGRARAEERMLDVFDIKVPTGGVTYSAKTETQTLVLLFRTKGRVKSPGGLVSKTQVGGRTAVSVTRELHIPATSPDVPPNAVAIPVSLHETSDQTLAAAVLKVAGPAPGSQTTARRLEISEVIT